MKTDTIIDYESLFELFVSDDELRPYMMQPFKQGGYYMATDAHSLIMMPCSKIELPFPEQTKPDACSIIPKVENCNRIIDINYLEQQLSPHYEEQTIYDKDCPECNGEGGKDCNLNHWHECDHCNGDGSLYKSTGKRIGSTYNTYRIGAVGFSHFQLYRLIEACKMIGVTEAIHCTEGEITPNVFKCGDIEILIMPWLYRGDHSTDTN